MPSLGFVAEMTRWALGQETVSGKSLPGDVNWQKTLELTFREGLAALVYSGLRLSGLQIPVEVEGQLRAAYLGAVLKEETWLEPGLELILGALQDSGFEPVVLKGAALAFTAYPHPALRSMGDIDLLLPRSHVVDAYELLLDSGFYGVPSGEQADHHLPLVRSRDGQLNVELHHDLIFRSSPYRMKVEEMLARCRRAQIGSVEAAVLDPADALHLACVHLAFSHRYRWFPLRTFVDISALSGCADSPVDWNLFVQSSQRWGTSGAAYWPLKMSCWILGAAVPQHVLDSLAPSQPYQRVFDSVLRPEYLAGLSAPAGAESLIYSRIMSLSLFAGCPRDVQARGTAKSVARMLSRGAHRVRDEWKSIRLPNRSATQKADANYNRHGSGKTLLP